ncbi:MAG: rRNA maturation RNase YbeY [Gammaproteobacteria bacterium]|nr:rRNA maturation RNase YbeY [Gammaproteobacteria bacterium]
MSSKSHHVSGGNTEITIQFATRKPAVPRAADIRRWILPVLQDRTHTEMTVRIVDEHEGSALNFQWRGKQGPTNVLSFPGGGMGDIAPALLGDIVVCAPIVAREAREQGKELQAHWAHMLIHGTLHLLGYDHQEPADAKRMEQLETDILCNFGYPDPYVLHETATRD